MELLLSASEMGPRRNLSSPLKILSMKQLIVYRYRIGWSKSTAEEKTSMHRRHIHYAWDNDFVSIYIVWGQEIWRFLVENQLKPWKKSKINVSLLWNVAIIGWKTMPVSVMEMWSLDGFVARDERSPIKPSIDHRACHIPSTLRIDFCVSIARIFQRTHFLQPCHHTTSAPENHKEAEISTCTFIVHGHWNISRKWNQKNVDSRKTGTRALY